MPIVREEGEEEETTVFLTPRTNGGSRVPSMAFSTPLPGSLSNRGSLAFSTPLASPGPRRAGEGLTFEEARALREADTEEVTRTLARLRVILTGVEFDARTAFATVSYREEDLEGEESFLHLLMWKPSLGSGVTNRQYREALEVVLGQLEELAGASREARARLEVLLDMKDPQGRTVLRYATYKWGKAVVLRLLQLGAAIREGPVTGINPAVVREFLDTKWRPQGYPDDEQDPDNFNYKIEFDFLFLQSPEKGGDQNQSIRVSQCPDVSKSRVAAVAQMAILVEISESEQHRQLLTHPVITTFLALQWDSFSPFYNLNTAFTFLTCLIANLFVLSVYGGKSAEPLSTRANWTSCEPGWSSTPFPSVFQNSAQEAEVGRVTVAWVALLTCTLAITARETVQLVVAWNQREMGKHLTSVENLLEVAFIVISLVLAVFTALPSQPVCAMRSLAATLLLISWILFFNMAARNPYFNTLNIHLTMFFKVMQVFIKIFVFFAPFILAFALFFYISLHKDYKKEEAPRREEAKTCSDIKQEILDEISQKGEFLDKVGFSVIKTMAMFVGELEFSDIPFDNVPYFSHVAFIIFVFLIVVVLMNLLTGLAVGETGAIKAEAEVCAQQVRLGFCLWIPSTLILLLTLTSLARCGWACWPRRRRCRCCWASAGGGWWWTVGRG